MGFTDSNGLKNTRRLPNGDFVHVIVTTIPPLGLSPSDSREKNRAQVNAAIMARFNNYGADDAAANFLTMTVPNDSYYDKLAQTLSDAVNAFPPGAQL
jgi:hypothetical protein